MRRRRATALWAVAVTSLPLGSPQEGAPPQCLPGDAKTCSPGLDLEDAHVAVRTAAAKSPPSPPAAAAAARGLAPRGDMPGIFF